MMLIFDRVLSQDNPSIAHVQSDSLQIVHSYHNKIYPDTIKLKSITVSAKHIEETHFSTYRIPKIVMEAQKERSLGEMLQKVAPIYLKDYGPGNTSTITLRGTNAAQTQIYWNGVPINAAGTGQTDFSTIPVMSGDEILILPGLVSLEKGSGGLGGSIEINNNPRWNENNRCEANIETGSFGYQSYGGKAAIRYKLFNRNFIRDFSRLIMISNTLTIRLQNPEKRKELGQVIINGWLAKISI
jgi:hypothetical protein